MARKRLNVDRVACPWLSKKFVDPATEFLFVLVEQVMPIGTHVVP